MKILFPAKPKAHNGLRIGTLQPNTLLYIKKSDMILIIIKGFSMNDIIMEVNIYIVGTRILNLKFDEIK